MPAHDLAVVGGDVVLDGGSVERVNLGVSDGRIVTLTDGPLDARETLDAGGLTVLPGVVDQHFHVFWNYEWETYENATRAAAKGGVTTVVDMPLDNPPTLTAEALRGKLSEIAGACHVDYASFGGYLAEDPSEMERMAEAGASCFKLFTGGVAPPGMYPGVDDGQLLDALRRAAAIGLPVTVHAETAYIVDFETNRLMGEGRTDMAAWDDARPWYSELAAAHTVALLAEVTGARVILAHVSSPQTMEALAGFRARGVDVWTETGHHYVCSTKEQALEDSRLKWNPPTRAAAEVERMWDLIADGEVNSVGSDHAPLPKAEGADVWSQPPGPGNNVQTILTIFATQARERGLPLGRIVDLVSTRPAKLFGLYPRKGAIRLGSDADLAIVDTNASRTLDPQELEYIEGQVKWSPFEGMDVTVDPVHTVLRGKVICSRGEILGTPGDGTHLIGTRIA
jgi:dihydroorotase (multifunctional complex type)